MQKRDRTKQETNEKKIKIWNFSEKIRKFSWFFFFSKSRICEEFTKLMPESELRICEDHEMWNHEMQGSPVFNTLFQKSFWKLIKGALVTSVHSDAKNGMKESIYF